MLESKKVLTDRAVAALELAKAAGARDAMAWVSAARSTSCEVRNGKLEKMQENNRRSLSLALYVDGRYATQSTNDLRNGELAAFIERAVALTRALEPDPYRELVDASLLVGRAVTGLDTVDASLRELTPEARLQRCLDLDAHVAASGDYISRDSWMRDSDYRMAGAATNGFAGTFEATSLGFGASLTLQDGDKKPEDGMGVHAHHASDLPSISWVADESVRLVQSRRGGRKGPTMTATMVVDRHAMPRLFGWLLRPAHGEPLQQGKSFWAGKLGQPLVSPLLRLADDPHIPRGSASKPFDGDGLPTKPRTVLEDGALQTYFLDAYYARKLGMSPTTGGTSNLVLHPGTSDRDGLIASVKRGVYVTDWLGGNCDSTSGDFSVGLRGHLIENGELTYPVGEMNLSGNILTLFGKVAAIGSDSWLLSSVRSPSVVFDGVSFSGA